MVPVDTVEATAVAVQTSAVCLTGSTSALTATGFHLETSLLTHVDTVEATAAAVQTSAVCLTGSTSALTALTSHLGI